MLNFPDNPTVNQVFTSGAQSWTWDGAKWVASGVYVGPPQFSNANRIINGDMRIDQRNNGASGTASNVYTIDRWVYNATQTGKGTWQRAVAGPALTALGFGYNLAFTPPSAYASLASDQFYFRQIIEADMVSDFAWGTPNAQPVTLSFWAFATLTGTFSGAIQSFPVPPARCYPFTFSIPVASTWTKITITIPGDTAGTWVMSGNLAGVGLAFDLGSGSTFRASPNAWANGNFTGAIGAVSIVGTASAGLNLTGVKLELGPVATPFNRKSPQESLADCQRYYQQFVYTSAGYAGAGILTQPGFTLLTAMRTTSPTAAVIGTPTYTNASALSFAPRDGQTANPILTVTATGGFAGTATVSFSAEL